MIKRIKIDISGDPDTNSLLRDMSESCCAESIIRAICDNKNIPETVILKMFDKAISLATDANIKLNKMAFKKLNELNVVVDRIKNIDTRDIDIGLLYICYEVNNEE